MPGGVVRVEARVPAMFDLRFVAAGLLPMVLACAQRVTPPSATTLSGASSDPRFDAELSAYPYPFPVRFVELASQRQTVKMAYMDAPATSQPNGHTVLLLHGKNFSASYWEPTIRFLTERGYRVIAPDQNRLRQVEQA